MSSAYLRLSIFLPAILIPAWDSSSLAFRLMYSAQKLNRQGDNTQPWCTPFPIWNQSIVSCLILTVVSWHAYQFLRRQVRWSGISIFFRNFHICLWLPIILCLGVPLSFFICFSLCPSLPLTMPWAYYWIGQKVHLRFPIRCYDKTQTNFLANPICCLTSSSASFLSV